MYKIFWFNFFAGVQGGRDEADRRSRSVREGLEQDARHEQADPGQGEDLVSIRILIGIVDFYLKMMRNHKKNFFFLVSHAFLDITLTHLQKIYKCVGQK